MYLLKMTEEVVSAVLVSSHLKMLHYTRYFVYMWELRLEKITIAAAVYFSSII